MPLYVFYPTLENGLCDTFQRAQLDSDADAWDRAPQVLDEHSNAATVVVYRDHKKVLTRSRTHPELAAPLRRLAPRRIWQGARAALGDSHQRQAIGACSRELSAPRGTRAAAAR